MQCNRRRLNEFLIGSLQEVGLRQVGFIYFRFPAPYFLPPTPDQELIVGGHSVVFHQAETAGGS